MYRILFNILKICFIAGAPIGVRLALVRVTGQVEQVSQSETASLS